MAKLTYKQRKELPNSEFALPGRRFPIPDAEHARLAIARAKEMYAKGKLTKEEYDTVIKKATAVLEREGVK